MSGVSIQTHWVSPFLRLCGGSSMIRLRSPRSFRSTGFSHTDKCMVGLKKNTLSSPVHTTHLEKREMLWCFYVLVHTHWNTTQQTFFFFFVFSLRNVDEEKDLHQDQSNSKRERILGHTWQLRMTETRWFSDSDVFLSSPTIFFFPQSSFISFIRLILNG